METLLRFCAFLSGYEADRHVLLVAEQSLLNTDLCGDTAANGGKRWGVERFSRFGQPEAIETAFCSLLIAPYHVDRHD
jgi:hypothetical protein